MTSAPRENRRHPRDPLATGEVRIAALAAALRAVRPEQEPLRPQDDDAEPIRRAA